MRGAHTEYNVQRAALVRAQDTFRHECLCANHMILAPPSDRYLRDRAVAFAHANGLTLGEMRPVTAADARGLETRMYKEIQGKPVVYLLRALMTSECFVELLVGGAATTFPSGGMLEFLKSAQRVLPPTVHPAQWAPLRQSLATGKRHIDLANLTNEGTVIEYRRKYVASRGHTTLLMVAQMDCATARSRVVVTESWSAEGQLQDRAETPDAEFQPFPNDPVELSIHGAVCQERRPRIDGAVARLKQLAE
jgi:hypothetical protein